MNDSIRNRILKYLSFIACPLIIWACSDDLSVSSDVSLDKGTDAIVINGEDGYFTLPIDTTAIVSVSLIDGDFLNNLGYGRLYFEQNDLSENRKAQVKVTFLDGKDSTFVICQNPFTRTSENGLRQFYRHHGLGYSYDATDGDYCNPTNIKCQILNRAVVDSLDIKVKLVNENVYNRLRYEDHVYTSVVEYVQRAGIDISAGMSVGVGAVEIGSFNVTNNCSIFEDGIIDTYIFNQVAYVDKGKYILDVKEIPYWIDAFPNLLTSSFRHALKKLEENPSDKAIDDFIYNYGTHIVLSALLGARLSLTIQTETWKYNDEQYSDFTVVGKVATFFEEKYEKHTVSTNYSVMTNSKCYYDVVGGNINAFGNLIYSTKFDSEVNIGTMIENWIEPIGKDENASELIGMSVIPIWSLIPNEEIADIVEARFTGNYSKLIESLGNKNFINTSFAARPTEVTCYIGNSTTNNKEKKTFQNPKTIDIIASNRHVATICKEYVPEITTSEKVYVAYPIYEGKVKLTDGLCIYNGKAYDVEWKTNQFIVKEHYTEGDDISENIYINYGVLSTTPINVSYQTSHQILGCERPGGIKSDGSVGGEMVPVFKHFGHFYLDNKKEYDNLPGWSYIQTEMEEASNYKTYFPEEVYSNRMVRNNDYIYIYNTTEISYE